MSDAAHALSPNQPIEYPESDGEPLGETDIHIEATIAALTSLKHWFRDAPDVYVASDNMLYFEEGVPSACVSPDVYVVRGIEKRLRRVYKVWEEGKGPDFVLEISSRQTRYRDQGDKRAIYAALGVKEYVLFDPTEDYLRPPLQMYRLAPGGEYQRVLPSRDGSLESQVLGLRLSVYGLRIRFEDVQTGWTLLHDFELRDAVEAERQARAEAQAERDAAEAERDEARARASALEEELRRLRARLDEGR